MFEYEDPAELIGRPLWNTFVMPENRAELEERTRRLLQGESLPQHPGWRRWASWDGPSGFQPPPAALKWQRASGHRGFYLDVSEQHRAQQALRESEAFLRLSQRVGKVGSWRWDLATGTVHWSDAMFPCTECCPRNSTAHWRPLPDSHTLKTRRAFRQSSNEFLPAAKLARLNIASLNPTQYCVPLRAWRGRV